MINNIRQCIVDNLLNVYPGIAIYDEDIPQNFKVPSFLITLTDHNYSKRINNKFNGEVSFDISFFSERDRFEIKNDCLKVQQDLFRNFDLIGKYRALDKQATIVDNVLHFTFKIKYSEIKSIEESKMVSVELNTNIKE
ncbi:MAG: hypothetical protein KHZ99_15410 [Clostridium sp.]|uniref:phage tail terminator family protein n=1 Tax=Clostridium sp. TaxID=1506 RepID=UPI0025BD9F2C|nr:hypothetical protein [Clostridium sp.]MBS4958412.1 hypothetical protein [Clostridium sp.]